GVAHASPLSNRRAPQPGREPGSRRQHSLPAKPQKPGGLRGDPRDELLAARGRATVEPAAMKKVTVSFAAALTAAQLFAAAAGAQAAAGPPDPASTNS